jgi:hypothetical protein
VRRLSSWFFFGIVVACFTVTAQENVLQEFSGSGTTTTGFFTVHDRWEVRWNSRAVVSVAVLSADGTIVAGAAGVLRGSLFVPMGGSYYLKISDGSVDSPANTRTPTSSTSPPASAGSTTAEATVAWHLQVVELAQSVGSDQALTVYNPFFIVPDSVITPVAPPPNVPPPTLTSDQIQSVVTIRGDNAQGTGFLMRSKDGTFVVTHLRLLAANLNVKILTSTGVAITPVSLKGALDCDLAEFTIEDDHYSYLPLPADPTSSVATGDPVIIPQIDDQGAAPVGKNGKVVSVSPERIDFDNKMAPGSSGSPVIDVKSGNVLAMLTSQRQVDLTNLLAQAWPANPAPGSAGIIPYYGLRLNPAQGWETYDWSRFLAETLFLKKFHETTRALDSYLNGKRRRKPSDDDNGPPDNRYYLNNAKIHAADDTYRKIGDDADRSERLDAARELLFDLQAVADTDKDTLQGMATNLYAFNRTWAQEELAYRTAIKKELDDLGSNIVRLDNIARYRPGVDSPPQ